MKFTLLLGVSFTTLFWTCWAQTNQTAFLDAFAHVPVCAVSVDGPSSTPLENSLLTG